MEILFIGYAVNWDNQLEYSGISIAGNKMQVNLLKQLGRREDIDLKCISISPVASFPKERRLFLKGKTINIVENVNSHAIGFCNLPLIKQITQTIGVYRCARKLVDDNTIVVAFNMFPQTGLPLLKLKKKIGCKIVAILADPPIDYNNTQNFVKKFFREKYDKTAEKALKSCENIIVLNEFAAKKYAPKASYIVIEGGIDIDQIVPENNSLPVKKNIVYSGALSEYSGILMLMKAMKYVNPDVVLEIYGSGPLLKKIKAIEKDCSNIQYMGNVSNEQMLKIQQEAYLLINPRPTKDKISQLTFPSKMFEYMLSNRPVLTTKLNGLSEDFLSRLFIIEEESPHGFADAINAAFNKPYDELLNRAKEAREFVIKEKNWEKQVNRIIKYIRGI